MSTNLQQNLEDSKNDAESQFRDALLSTGVDPYSIIEAARELTLSDAGKKPSHFKLGRNYMAEIMYNNIIGIATDVYGSRMKQDKENRHYLELTPTVRLYFKKLNDKYLPSNIVTKYTKALRGQELFNEGGTQIHVVNVGYIVKDNDYTQDFKGIYASYVNKYYPSDVVWVIDLSIYKSTGIIVPNHEPAIAAEPLVKVPNIGGRSEAEGQK